MTVSSNRTGLVRARESSSSVGCQTHGDPTYLNVAHVSALTGCVRIARTRHGERGAAMTSADLTGGAPPKRSGGAAGSLTFMAAPRHPPARVGCPGGPGPR